MYFVLRKQNWNEDGFYKKGKNYMNVNDLHEYSVFQTSDEDDDISLIVGYLPGSSVGSILLFRTTCRDLMNLSDEKKNELLEVLKEHLSNDRIERRRLGEHYHFWCFNCQALSMVNRWIVTFDGQLMDG